MQLNPLVSMSPVVKAALQNGQPVVALESTIISHGMPYPKNVETALRVEATVRESGAVPATIAVIGGQLRAGLSEAEIENLGKKGTAVTKVSRRDLPVLVARKGDGATTVAATMIIAALAGIRVFATGGIGGVHRGAERTMDISADLQELARTNVAVVCAGAKSILDLRLTLEYLETMGVPVLGFQTDELPAFYTRTSGLPVDYRMETASEITKALHTKWQLGLHGGAVIANPIPEAYAMPQEEMDRVIDLAIAEAAQQDIVGKALTPFLLSRIEQLTKGDSLEANIELVLNNARLAAAVSGALCSLSG
ncbi:MAG: pseudouridine-5'-phosphate glycosidase [Phaeodactylibacter xiamenensis]|uniref:Pseudouridine-5'-phosphate glycosidase n=1 Tax=Phaeodactylibacter xiamenensis TaxID=1524460 RepID=A0A098S676_9BACT|nr:pseudouridine-5'-phosphate glycosidase [Phaeodactylibacter xiamenensis]KGE87620.1 pseudouridine-5'-phosphate glycosidase [Phaeodactylibacter xiamenensis]